MEDQKERATENGDKAFVHLIQVSGESGIRVRDQVMPQAHEEAYADPPREALESSLTSVVREPY